MAQRARKGNLEEAVAVLPRLSREQVAMVGVSGGRDSVALLHALVTAGYHKLIVCHLDHGLREDSEADAWFVAELASHYDLPFEADRVNVRAIAEEHKLSLEAAGRETRYQFFAQVGRVHWCPRLLLAHHADDQVETLLLNLFRGSGRPGLAGMQRHTVREVHGARLELHRPLLGIWREDIQRYVTAHRLKFQEDESNTDRQFTRNRVRHDLLAEMEKVFGRDVRASLLRTAEILGEEEAYLARQTPPTSRDPLKVEKLKPMPVALQRRIIMSWLQANAVEDIGFDDVENVRALLTEISPAKVNVAGGAHVRRRAGEIFIE